MAASGKKNMFNEATRVQMPAMVHLTRLGYGTNHLLMVEIAF